jgi:hypothetical protein
MALRGGDNKGFQEFVPVLDDQIPECRLVSPNAARGMDQPFGLQASRLIVLRLPTRLEIRGFYALCQGVDGHRIIGFANFKTKLRV